jgi:hypothetical protein
MGKLLRYALVVVAGLVLGFATIALATDMTRGYPMMCVDDSRNPTEEGSRWVVCGHETGEKGPITVNGSNVQILASKKILHDVNFCLYFENSGGNALTDLDVQVSPDGSHWHSVTFTECDSLGTSTMCTYCVDGNAYGYIKARASSGASTTVSVWYTSNRG